MKKATNKLMSFLAAFAMVLSVLVAPFTSANAAGETTTLNVHKLAAKKFSSDAPFEHDGKKITNFDKIGTDVQALKGVEFTVYQVLDPETFNNYKANNNKYDAGKGEVPVNDNTIPTDETTLTNLVNQNKIKKVKAITTGEEGDAKFENLPRGNYWILETKRPTQVTAGLAIPTAISLPLLDTDGNEMSEVHIYPKNLTQKPEMDKAFGQQELEDKDSKMLEDWQEQYGPIVNEYTRQKALVDSRVGSSVPYEVKTELKKGQIYDNLYWSDYMTAGLTYNGDLSVKVGETALKTDQYTVDQRPGVGFELTINADAKIGENSINDLLKSGNVTITLNYSATVNDANVVDRPEANNITFSPGQRNPRNNNTPKTTTPEDKTVQVTKTWAKGEAPAGVVVTYFLIQKTDGQADKVVATATVNTDGTLTVSSNEGITATNEGYNVKFDNVPVGSYVVEEAADGYDPEYTSATGVTNTKNPNRITPTPVRNVTGGKRFVKADETTGERLQGAEFAIKHPNGKYLAHNNENQATLKKAYDDAQAAYLKELDKYNEDNTSTTKARVNELKVARDNAFDAYQAAKTWKFVDKIEDAYKFISDEQGKFEVKGLSLKEGYQAIETKSPNGYADTNNAVKSTFAISENSYTTEADGVTYASNESVKGDTGNQAIRINNQRVTIPQTGGIGSLIFIVAGLALMGVAFVAMKRRNSYEEA